MDKGRILVVDDDALFRISISDVLGAAGFSVVTASSGLEALSIVEKDKVDIVLTDLVMPDINGIEVIERTKQHNTLIDVIVVTGHGTIETAIEALRKGAFDYVRKPINQDELLLTVASCMEKKELLEENQEMRQSLKLFEVSRTLLSMLDISKLYSVALDAIFQVVPAKAGLVAFYADEFKRLEVKDSRGLDSAEGEVIMKAVRDRCDRVLAEHLDTVALSEEELRGLLPPRFAEYNALLIIPIHKSRMVMGFFMLLCSGPRDAMSAKDLANALFVVEHASQAFENALKYADAKEMAYIDSLTNLYNSKYLDMALDKELKRASRLLMPVTVLFIDIDNFKKINDTNDHLIGSRVLIEVSKIFLANVREVDTVVRYGGDEYVVVLVDADYNRGFRVADRIRQSVATHEFLGEEGLSIRLTVSIGMATYPVHTKDKKELLKTADKAMYRAKDISRNTVYLAPVPGRENEDILAQ